MSQGKQFTNTCLGIAVLVKTVLGTYRLENDIRYTNYYLATKKRWKKQLFSHQTPGQELQMDTKYPFGYKQGKEQNLLISN